MLSNNKLVILILTLNIVIVVVQSWPTVKLSIIKYSFKIIESENVDFNITNLESGGNIMYIYYKKDIFDVWINIALHFETINGEYATEFMNKTLNVCKLFNNRRYQPLLSVLYEALYEKFPSMPKKCPIKKNLYILSFVNYETDKIPPIWPDNTMRATVTQLSFEREAFKPLLSFILYIKPQKK